MEGQMLKNTASSKCNIPISRPIVLVPPVLLYGFYCVRYTVSNVPFPFVTMLFTVCCLPVMISRLQYHVVTQKHALQRLAGCRTTLRLTILLTADLLPTQPRDEASSGGGVL
jgi:hypothetical protein